MSDADELLLWVGEHTQVDVKEGQHRQAAGVCGSISDGCKFPQLPHELSVQLCGVPTLNYTPSAGTHKFL